ncbi:hypothetical protein H375_4640 [Rickettsia prowazekii str. Breinl]|nr:hypothetical protein H374_9330 [Rickettsia prowazekii str. NMRC Madrid E]AGJ02689.1 hypothetical protein H375_4640 [Rickettsia prowazekii str. Breinl]EOB10675.1 hypothetical protein H376_110 [Rickettsia prowazekii str. GvF12]EOB11127.1 hypothetical protein H377_1040 [Rickettsia prowazekii str. Cairo 3]
MFHLVILVLALLFDLLFPVKEILIILSIIYFEELLEVID